LRRYRPAVPGILVAVAAATIVSALAGLDIPTIGSRFGGVPQSLPIPSLPAVSVGAIVEILPDAFSFALLGAIESLLSATVADGMSGRRHRSNCELVGQGAANIAAQNASLSNSEQSERSAEAQVRLQDAADDVDRSVVAVEQRGRAHEAQRSPPHAVASNYRRGSHAA